MLITPLQHLLMTTDIPEKEILQAINRSRTTLWRWKVGKSFPERIDVDALIELFPNQLDHNGCYEKTVRVDDERG